MRKRERERERERERDEVIERAREKNANAPCNNFLEMDEEKEVENNKSSIDR
jgi:hypothetical protein